MEQWIVVTFEFADQWYRQILAEHEPLDDELNDPAYVKSRAAMDERRRKAMTKIDAYLERKDNYDGDTNATLDKHFSRAIITLPKKSDMDWGLIELAKELWDDDCICGLSVLRG